MTFMAAFVFDVAEKVVTLYLRNGMFMVLDNTRGRVNVARPILNSALPDLSA